MTDHEHRSPDLLLESRLDAWGAAERSRVIEPPRKFPGQVRAAHPRRTVVRVIKVCVLAASLAVVAYLLSTVDLESVPSSGREGGVVVAASVPARALSVGTGRNADVEDVFDLLDSMPAPAPKDAPIRAADAYCTGCFDELSKI